MHCTKIKKILIFVLQTTKNFYVVVYLYKTTYLYYTPVYNFLKNKNTRT